MSGEPLVTFVRDEVFPFFAAIGDEFGLSFMAQARLVIDEPTVLTQIVTLVNELKLEDADPDTKGDLFEHVLRQIKQAGELGQFRTPRHIIRAIVDLVDPDCVKRDLRREDAVLAALVFVGLSACAHDLCDDGV